MPDFEQTAPARVEPLWRARRRALSLRGSLASRAARWFDVAVACWTVATSRCDLVYVNSTSAAAYCRAGLLLGKRVVLHVHESAGIAKPFLTRTGMSDLRSYVPEITLVACSPSVAADLRALGVAANEVHLVPSVPDTDLVLRLAKAPYPAPSEDGVRIGCCGAVEERKGVDLWLAAAALVLKQEDLGQVSFVWVGQGEPPAVPADQPVSFVGGTANPFAWVSGFDIVTLPSRDDPYPLVVVEAMLLGKPVVAFDVGGVADQLGDSGVLVPAGDVTAFAEALSALVADPARRLELGARARRRALAHFSRKAFAAGLAEVIGPAA